MCLKYIWNSHIATIACRFVEPHRSCFIFFEAASTVFVHKTKAGTAPLIITIVSLFKKLNRVHFILFEKAFTVTVQNPQLRTFCPNLDIAGLLIIFSGLSQIFLYTVCTVFVSVPRHFSPLTIPSGAGIFQADHR